MQATQLMREVYVPPPPEPSGPPRRWQSSWQGKTENDILLALCQSAAEAPCWAAPRGLQLEWLTSREPWAAADEAENRLAYDVMTLRMAWHRRVALGALAAGCDTVLRTLARGDTHAEAVVLQLPRLPSLHTAPQLAKAAAANLAARGTAVLVLCGSRESDCLCDAWALAGALNGQGGQCRLALCDDAAPGRFAAQTAEFLAEALS